MNIKINAREKQQVIENFWNCVHFHPTDAIEDDWGQKIINNIHRDSAASFMRVYAMLEDIVKTDGDGNIYYDFSLNDIRLDYLAEKGFNLLICMNFMPDAIAKNPVQDIGIPRYKGKRANNSVPASYELWEEACYTYASHILERYGEATVKKWRFHCWNEPDHEYWVTNKTCFDYEKNGDTDKIDEYVKLYDYFERGMHRASPALLVGGPSAAFCEGFIKDFLHHAAKGINCATGKRGSHLDFLTIHAYSDLPYAGTDGTISPKNILRRVECARAMLDNEGFYNAEILVDEWGAAAGGFLSMKKNPLMELRENEFYSAYYFRLIDMFTHSTARPCKMLICLSGQHKSKYDFDGYRSMFTLSGYKKPIYNAFILAARLGSVRLATNGEGCIATKGTDGRIIAVLYHGGENPSLLAPTKKTVSLLIEGVNGEYKAVTSIIDRHHSNSYRYWQSIGSPEECSDEQKKDIALSGEIYSYEKNLSLNGSYNEKITLDGHSVVMIELIPLKEEG